MGGGADREGRMKVWGRGSSGTGRKLGEEVGGRGGAAVTGP